MANQIFKFNEGDRAVFATVDGVDYVALQNMDECNLSEQVAEIAENYECDKPTILLIDTSVTDEFGCEFSWYKCEGYLTDLEFSTATELVGTRPIGR